MRTFGHHAAEIRHGHGSRRGPWRGAHLGVINTVAFEADGGSRSAASATTPTSRASSTPYVTRERLPPRRRRSWRWRYLSGRHRCPQGARRARRTFSCATSAAPPKREPPQPPSGSHPGAAPRRCGRGSGSRRRRHLHPAAPRRRCPGGVNLRRRPGTGDAPACSWTSPTTLGPAVAAVWQDAGGTVVPGLEMLIYQAVEQVRHFTGLAGTLTPES